MPDIRSTELVPINSLRPHPRNYRSHPEDQLEHIRSSISEHGFYRNVVVAEDDTILAGHGVVIASEALGLSEVPVVRLPIDPNSPAAMKVLTGDNAIGRLAFDDDRALTNILKDLHDDDLLLGTGFDGKMLAGLTVTTRPASEIADFDEAAAWAGLGAEDYEVGEAPVQLRVTFPDMEAREKFAEEIGLRIDIRREGVKSWSTRWPWTDRHDTAAIKFVEDE